MLTLIKLGLFYIAVLCAKPDKIRLSSLSLLNPTANTHSTPEYYYTHSAKAIQIESSLEDNTLKWSYTNCKIVSASLYFSDSSNFLLSTLYSNPQFAIIYMSQILSNYFECSKTLTYTIPYKGDIILLLVSAYLNETTYSIFKYFSVERYSCKFSFLPELEILESAKGLKFNSNALTYTISSHGDLEDHGGVLGDLSTVFCNSKVTPDIWLPDCISPESFIGSKVSHTLNNPQDSCILQRPGYNFSQSSLGKCSFRSPGISGYLIFQPRVSYLQVSGFSTSVATISLNSYPLTLSNTSTVSKISGSLPSIPIIGTTMLLQINSSPVPCTVGIYKPKSISNPSYSLHGPILIIISFLVFSISSLFICRSTLIK